MRKSRIRKNIVLYVILIIFLVITLLPYFWLVLTSFKTRVDSFAIPPKIFFSVMLFTLWIGLALGLPSSFAFSRFKTRKDQVLLNYLLGTRFTPVVVLALPLYLLMSKIGMLNSYVGIIVAHVAFNLPFVIWMMKGFFDAIPKEIDEAARLEG